MLKKITLTEDVARNRIKEYVQRRMYDYAPYLVEREAERLFKIFYGK